MSDATNAILTRFGASLASILLLIQAKNFTNHKLLDLLVAIVGAFIELHN